MRMFFNFQFFVYSYHIVTKYFDREFQSWKTKISFFVKILPIFKGYGKSERKEILLIYSFLRKNLTGT